MEQTRESIIDRVKRLHGLLSTSLSGTELEISPGLVSHETLLDSLLLLYDECNNEFLMKDPLISEFVEKYRSSILKIRDLCISLGDFETIKVINKGRFADVSVVRDRENSNVYVIKKLRKTDILNAYESICFENERNVLLVSRKHEEASKWIPELFYSFQNMKYIYYVLEYCPGGNLSTMLEYYKNVSKKDSTKNIKENIPEHMLKFYIPELVEAIHSVHSIGFAHRDIRPDNFVFDRSGHLKVVDFDSSAKLSKNGVINTKLMMSIPHYTAPEIFKFLEKTGKPYDYQCDWWSLGVVLFELISGYVPFTSEEVPKLHLSITYSRKVQFPKDICISSELKYIVQNLLQPVGKRLNYKKIKALDYFDGTDWTSLNNRDPPFVPSVTSQEDTSYFKTFDIQRPTPKVEDFKRRFTGRNLPFLGFTYMGNFEEPEQESESISNTVVPFFIVPKSSSISTSVGRRQTEHFKKSIESSSSGSSTRHSVSVARTSEAASECSNDSYQSAASVRLENEVDQLHLFYNEKALIIEEKIRNQFHDAFNCMTADQQKLLQEKEELSSRLTKLQREHDFVMGELERKTEEFEDCKKACKTQAQEADDQIKEFTKNQEKHINKFEEMDKMKKDIIKLNISLEEKTKALKDLEEKLHNMSSQQAAKLVVLNKTKTDLRNKSAECDRLEQENAMLKNQVTETNKKMSQLIADSEKKNKVTLDLELKMTSDDRNGDRHFVARANDEELHLRKSIDEIVKQFEKSVREVLKENLFAIKEENAIVDLESVIQAIHKKINELSVMKLTEKKFQDQPLNNESSVVPILKSQIERLESQLIRQEQLLISHREKVDQLTNEIFQLGKEKSDLNVELQVALMQSKTLENQLECVKVEKENSQEMLQQFENTMKCVLKENLCSKENQNSSDIESMFSQVQRRLSILSERQIVPQVTQSEEKQQRSKSNSVQVLQAQIERLEEQMEKAREKAILRREEANAAKSKLVIAEKQLADLKIDLRIANRETKEAEEEIKELKEKLEKQSSDLNAELIECHDKLKIYQREFETLKETLKNKDNELRVRETSIEKKTFVIQSLEEEVQSMKFKIDNLSLEKKETGLDLKKRDNEIKKLNGKLEVLEKQAQANTGSVVELTQKESEWKSKCSKLMSELESLRETCELQDRLNVAFETKQQKLEEDLRKKEDEKLTLQEKLDNIQEELKSTRKMLNEEKSLKSIVDNEIRHLKERLGKQDEEMKILIEEKEEQSKEILCLEEKIQQYEDCILQTNDSIEKSNQGIEMIRKENNMLKEERTDLLTRIHRLKEEKASLQEELNEAIGEINNLQKIYSESQQVLDQVKAYYEDRHMKDTTTLQQYSKLNEFLQTKVDSKKQKRKFADKLFGIKGKENSNPKEIENLLYSERKKNKELAEQLYQMRTEMMILKSSENICRYSTPKKNSQHESNSKSEFDGKDVVTSESGFSEMSTPLRARLRHHIPHKFDTKLCKKVGIKCAVCGQTLSLGHMSQCKECHVRCHVVCSTNMAPSCGLSKALMYQIPIAAKKMPSASSISLGSSVKSEIEGSLQVLRNKNWINMYLVVDSEGISLFEKAASQKAPSEHIEFDSVAEIDSELNLENGSDAEKRRVLKITYRSAKKHTNTLVLLLSSEDERSSWMNVLKRNMPESQKCSLVETRSESEAKGTILIRYEKSNDFDLFQMISLSSKLTLMATDRGLFSLKLNLGPEMNKNYCPVKISGGIDRVSKMKISTKSKLAFFICGEHNMFKKCDLRMLVSNAEAAQCCSPRISFTDVSSLGPIEHCKLFALSSYCPILAIATDEYIMILSQVNEGFDEIKFEDDIVGVIDMVFTSSSLLFCTKNEFYSVSLASFEKTKLNVSKQTVGESMDSSMIKGIVKINHDTFLFCDRMFGIFVNADGKRIKQVESIKWHLSPHEIVYNKPFLCLSHDSCVSLVYLPSSNEDDDKKYKFCVLDYCQPSILGVIKEPMDEIRAEDPVRGIFIKEQSNDGKYQVSFLDPLAYIRRSPKDSWSSIDTQLTGETTDEECVGKSLNISDQTDISLHFSDLEESSFHS